MPLRAVGTSSSIPWVAGIAVEAGSGPQCQGGNSGEKVDLLLYASWRKGERLQGTLARRAAQEPADPGEGFSSELTDKLILACQIGAAPKLARRGSDGLGHLAPGCVQLLAADLGS